MKEEEINKQITAVRNIKKANKIIMINIEIKQQGLKYEVNSKAERTKHINI
jgi:hypothetical protein